MGDPRRAIKKAIQRRTNRRRRRRRDDGGANDAAAKDEGHEKTTRTGHKSAMRSTAVATAKPRARAPLLSLAVGALAASSCADASAAAATSFVAPARRTSSARRSSRHPPRTSPPLSSSDGSGSDEFQGEFGSGGNFYDDFDSDDLSHSSASMFASLRARKEHFAESSRRLLERWRTGSAKTFAAFSINEEFYRRQEEGSPSSSSSPFGSKGDDDELEFDWVRRISAGAYPRVACGSAHGSICVADVEAQRVLGVARGAHSSSRNSMADGLDERLRKYLYGDYDGGGVLAVAMSPSGIVASSGREGGVKLHRLEGGELRRLGDVPSLKRPLPGVTPVLATCLAFDASGRLHVGGQDGLLRIVSFEEDYALDSGGGGEVELKMQVALVSSSQQLRSLRPPSPVLALDVSEELEMVATAHANGNVCIFSVHDGAGSKRKGCDGTLLGIWNPFADTNDPCHARSVAFAPCGGDGDSAGDEPSWCLAVGGGNGQLWMHEISPLGILTSPNGRDDDRGDEDDSAAPLFKVNSMQQIKPSHRGPVISLASRPGGILVSAGHDGMLRVTSLRPNPKALYGLGGYKVWVGSVCVDPSGRRLISDGRDDVVVVHDFSREEDEEEWRLT
ncbi:hypothetical protein ACHAWF_011671 [Thalassiosira exigua]